jgi:hypothetical protein
MYLFLPNMTIFIDPTVPSYNINSSPCSVKHHLLSADYLFLANAMGMAGAASSWPCIWCEVAHTDIADFSKVSRPRQYSDCLKRAHAHETPFTCDCCNKTFQTQADVDAEEAPDSVYKRGKFMQAHKGQHWHRAPVFPFDLSTVKPCILHLLLRVTDVLFQQTIRGNAKDDETAAKINEALQVSSCLTLCHLLQNLS